MLFGIKDLDGFVLAAQDGELGQVREAYFDDRHWVVRHLVVETGGWFSGREVLISPHAVRKVDAPGKRLEVMLTREQVERAPGVETHAPVSRPYEIAAYDHYRYPYYWSGSGLWGMLELPLGSMGEPLAGLESPAMRNESAASQGDAVSRLRSSAEMSGFSVVGRDEDIGHVDDFLFDEHSWQIRCVIIDTHNWLPDRLVLVATTHVQSVDWAERRVSVRLSRQAIEGSVPYQRHQTLGDADLKLLQAYFETA